MLKSLFVLVLIASTPSWASGTPTSGITVSGQCDHLVTPDRGSIVLTADVVKPTIVDASREATRAYEDLKTKIESLKLADLQLQTTEYSLQEATEWRNNKSVHLGFRARMGLQVATSELNRLGDVIQAAASLNIQDTGQLQTFLSRPKMKLEKESCLAEAVVDAHGKAEKLAGAAGAHVGPARGIIEEGATRPEPPLARPMAAAMNAGKDMMPYGGPNVVAAPERIEVSVSVTYEIN